MNKVILIVAGVVMLAIGAATLFAPVAFHALNGTELGDSPALLSEIRAPGGALVVLGLVVLAGAFRSALTVTSAWLGAVLYLSYGLSRVVSVVADGLPPTTLTAAAVAELLLGLACLRPLKSRTAR